MVEYPQTLDSVFSSLADPTRRDILQRVSGTSLTIGEIAKFYDLTFAAISKHIKVLEKAKLVVKHKKGKEQFVQLAPASLAPAADYLEAYRSLWENRLDSLDAYLKETKEQ